MHAAKLLSIATILLLIPIHSIVAAPGTSSGSPRSVELNERGVKLATMGKLAEAEKYFRQALAVDHGNITAAFNLAGIYLRMSKAGAAIKLLKEYTVSYKEDAGLFARLGDAYFATKDLKHARESYENALKLDPNYKGVHSKLATIMLMNNDLASAEKLLLRAAELDPSDEQVLANLASVFLATGKAEKAISTAKRALQIQPSSDLYITLGSAYELLNDPANALIAFKRARDLGSKDKHLLSKISALEKINSKG
ncbi:MAG: tetratricopeptide repeat protein [Candidatus Dadabacteria bacterium]|nr:MAG: tetratricopeptide repeat protein [Candidatus Dadabacteria bacterium]